jgi:predicted acyl esterase
LCAIDSAKGSPAEIATGGPPAPLTPGEPVRLRFTMTVPSARLDAGNRLVLSIASRTDLFRPSVQDGFVAPDLAVPPFFARNTAFLGPDTSIELTMRPT